QKFNLLSESKQRRSWSRRGMSTGVQHLGAEIFSTACAAASSAHLASSKPEFT
ncbi:hypothetical protein HGM15179_017126, partial [Zosterops borbonicus]